jgi:hypothetical protein
MNTASMVDSYLVKEERREYLPTNYGHAETKIDTAAEIVGEELLQSLSHRKLITPLWSVGTPDKRFRTMKPIAIHVYFDDGLFVAESDTLLLYGTGISPEEAIEELGLHIIHFHEYYKNLDWSQVAGEGLRLKGLYENLLLED